MLASTIRAPSSARSRGSTALTVALVPTGMKQGVSTTPCGVVEPAGAGAPVARLDGEREALSAHPARLPQSASIASPKL